MSMKVFDKEVTRREFMRLMGKGTACIAASTPLMQLFGATKAEAEAGAVSVYATAQGVLVSNAARCTGSLRFCWRKPRSRTAEAGWKSAISMSTPATPGAVCSTESANYPG